MRSDRSTTTARPLVVLARVVDLVLLAVVAFGLSAVILGRVLPALGHPVYVVAGPSMTPAIPMGAAVVLESIPPTALAVGDVVTLQSGPDRAVFTHRITRTVDRDGEIWIETKGDANAKKDPSITPTTAVIGRVAASVPYAGFLLALMSTPQGVVLVLSTGALLLLLGWWLDDIVGARRRAAVRAATPASGIGPTREEPSPVLEDLAPAPTGGTPSSPALAPLTPVLAAASVEDRLAPGASARRRARHPAAPAAGSRRRAPRTGRARATGPST